MEDYAVVQLSHSLSYNYAMYFHTFTLTSF
jgi:hypothetical protein